MWRGSNRTGCCRYDCLDDIDRAICGALSRDATQSAALGPQVGAEPACDVAADQAAGGCGGIWGARLVWMRDMWALA